MLFRETSPEVRGEKARAKQRKRIDRLRRKGHFVEAIELQRKICDASPRDADEWTIFADLCREGRRLDLALAARYEAAKVRRCGADDWLELAEEAEDWGFSADAVEARFRAADACAVAGNLHRALDLLDKVLEDVPGHTQAKRIRRLVASRITAAHPAPSETPLAPLPEEPATDTEQDHEPTLSFVGDRAHRTGGTGVEGPEDLNLDEATRTHFPGEIDLGTSTRPTPAGYVCAPQLWPSILDTRTLTFIGSVGSLGTELLGLTETIVLGEGSAVYHQGQPGQLLYILQSGTVEFSRERPDRQDLGTVKPGHFFGEIGALMGLPSTVTATATEPCLLRLVNRREVQQHVEGGHGVPPLISLLRAWYLETVLHLCPLFVAEQPAWPEGEGIRWITLRPGERLTTIEQGGPMHVIVTGFARVTIGSGADEQIIGYLCPGDPSGEFDPSPVTVTAESVLTALQLPRDRLDCLTPAGRGLFEERLEHCRAALARTETPTGEGRELILPADGVLASEVSKEAVIGEESDVATTVGNRPQGARASAASATSPAAEQPRQVDAATAGTAGTAAAEQQKRVDGAAAPGGLSSVTTAETLTDDDLADGVAKPEGEK